MRDPEHASAPSSGPDRRQLLKAAAVTGGAVWAAPAILTLDKAHAASTCCAPTGPGTLLASCQPETNQPTEECEVKITSSTTVCRLQGQRMLFSRDTGGQFEPYPDELVVLTVVPPVGSGGTTQIQNFIRWQADCREPTPLPDVIITGNDPCGTTGNPSVDVTNLFGDVCGVFTVTAEVRNKFSPFSWSTMYIFPA
jgi:hypothetical protein